MAIDFFERQDDARRRTGLLIAYFALAVLLIILAVYAAFTAVALGAFGQHKGGAPGAATIHLLDWGRLAVVAAVTAAVVLVGSLYKVASLNHGGGESVARLLGGQPVDPATADPAERRLLNVVEEMALASGTPVPPVFLLEHERGINAFAAGFTPGDAVIGITRGSLQYLDRDELQGVIAHEFSHILNGDMRLNLRLIGLLHGILLIALIGELIVRTVGNRSGSSSRDDGKKGEGGSIVLFGIALLAIGYVGLFFGRLIKSAVCRQREYLADASAVQFTRNPDGIAGALKKIGGMAKGSRVESPNAEQASHLFFGEGVASAIDAMATHPPLEERIRRIDPTFDGEFPDVEPIAAEAAPRAAGRAASPLGAAFPVGIMGTGARFPLDPALAVATVGAPSQEHVDYAAGLLATLPGPIAAAAREPFAARAVIYALLLDGDEAVRKVQLDRLERHAEPGTVAEVLRLAPLVEGLAEEARIPLVDLALPALRNLAPPQYETFRGNIAPLVAADQRVSLFEFALQRMLLRHLDRSFPQRKPPATRFRAQGLGPLLGDAAVVLSALATIGQEDPEDVARAYATGVEKLGPPAGMPGLLPRDACSLDVVDRALDRLDMAVPAVKRPVLDACAACISADGQVTIAEAELLRAIADALGCPMPPLAVGRATAA
jgi:Zn-dependent protease with chaperone function